MEILKAVERGTKKKGQIAKMYKIPASTLSTLLLNKEKIIASYKKTNASPMVKCLRLSSYKDVDSELYAWYKQMKNSGAEINKQILHNQAARIADSLGYNEEKELK